MWQTDGQRDGQTDIITTPKTALAYARAVKKTKTDYLYSKRALIKLFLNKTFLTEWSDRWRVIAEIARGHKPYIARTRLRGLHFCCWQKWQYWSSYSEFDAVGSESCRCVRNNAIGPFKVIECHRFWYRSKARICDFLLVTNTNLCSMWFRFRVIAAYWSHYRFWQRVPLFNSFVRGKPVNSGLRNLASKQL